MKKLTIELDGNWILGHKDDNELPVSILKGELSKLKGVEIKADSLTSLTLVYDDKDTDLDKIRECVKQFFSDSYPQDDNFADIVSFQLSEESEDNDDGEDEFSKEIKARRDELEKRRQEVKEQMNKMFEEAKIGARKSNSDSKIDPMGQINALVGASEFKQLAQEIVEIAGEIKRTNTHEVFTKQCYLFSIGDGCGLSTYLELFAELVDDIDLCDMASSAVREERLPAYRDSTEPFDDIMRVLNNGNKKAFKVLCVDISEWMNKTDSQYFKRFLRAVEIHTNEYIIVFRIPFVDKDILAKIQYSISDLLSVRAVTFPPLNQNEIQACAVKEFKRFGYSVAKSVWQLFFERIAEEKGDGKFYGINTVNKVVREFIYQKHLSNAKKKTQSNQISIVDVRSMCRDDMSSHLSGMEQLNRLVGIESVKSRVEEIVAQIELALKDGSIEKPCIHMRFVGNPGTGKTTVARIIGRILKDKGVLRVGAFFEYAGRDFCGRYVGETAPKTTSICRDAYGSVLFIDEAYSLYRADNDSRDFGKEVLDTLIAEMENHRNDLVVIMAGYTDDMDKLMKGNIGLASRMPYIVEFPNFTKEQLYDIFRSMVNEKFKCDDSLFDVAHKFFDGLSDDILSSKEFSNARYVRNLFERTWAKAAMRCQLTGKKQIILTGEDFEQASADKEFTLNMPKKTRIGFNI